MVSLNKQTYKKGDQVHLHIATTQTFVVAHRGETHQNQWCLRPHTHKKEKTLQRTTESKKQSKGTERERDGCKRGKIEGKWHSYGCEAANNTYTHTNRFKKWQPAVGERESKT